MSTQPLTYEGVLEMFQEVKAMIQETSKQIQENAEQMKKTERMSQETNRKIQETAEQIKRTEKQIGALGSRIGDIVENMVGGRILDKFQALGYEVDDYTRRHTFRNKKLGIKGEIDLMLHDDDVAILIEVKTTLEVADVRRHIERMEKYRRFIDAWGPGSHIRYIGAVAGAVVKDEAEDFAHANGLYTIVQSGEAVEIVPTPEGFAAKKW